MRMLLTQPYIDNRYVQGLGGLSDMVYAKFIRKLYGVQYKNTRTDDKLLLLLSVVDNWDNTTGATTNYITEEQLVVILDKIGQLSAESVRN